MIVVNIVLVDLLGIDDKYIIFIDTINNNDLGGFFFRNC